MNDLKLVYYNDKHGRGQRSFECVTNDFDKWLEGHNSERKADGNEPEEKDEFDVESITPILF